MAGGGISIRTGMDTAKAKGFDAIAAHLVNALYGMRCAVRWTDEGGDVVQCDGSGSGFCFGFAPKSSVHLQIVGIPLCDDHDTALENVHAALIADGPSLDVKIFDA